MATRVMARNISVDAFISSPAKRAKKTAELFAETMKQAAEEIIFISSLYHAPPEVFFDVIKDMDDSFETIAVFAHNPGITYFVNQLVTTVRIDNMPTCAVFAVQAPVSQWKEFVRAKKEFLFFDYPKNS